MPPSGCLLLAAGRGRRLRPLTDLLPKAALPLLDIPLGAFGLERLTALGRPTTVNLHHLAAEGRAALEPYTPPTGLDCFVEGPEAFGTAGTLGALARRWPAGVATWNCDFLSDLDLLRLLATHEASGAPVTLAVRRVERGADFEVSGGRATAFIDRQQRPDEPGARFLGAAVLGPGALDLLPQGRPTGLGETLFPRAAAAGEFGVHVHEGYALDVGTLDRYLTASLDLLAGRVGAQTLRPPGTVLAVEGGRAYIGPGATAAPGSLDAGAVVLAGALVEAGARLERAVVWPGEIVPSGTQVRDSVWALGRALPGREK